MTLRNRDEEARASSPATPAAVATPAPAMAAAAVAPALAQHGRMRSAIAYGTEALIALGLALVFFGIFLALLNVFFPTGIRLRELVAIRRAEVSEPSVTTAAELARLSVLHNDVRSKPAGAVAWGAAAPRLALYDRDAIQTLSRGRGLVTFDDGDQIHLEKNSLIIISARSAATGLEEWEGPGIVLVNGEIWGSLKLAARKKMRVTLPGGDVHLTGGTKSGAEFRVAVREDKSSTITLYKGEASVSSKAKTVSLRVNQGTRMNAVGELTTARDLPPAPRLIAPTDGTEMRYGDFPPQVLFQWGAVPGADRYHVVVARDREMKDVFIDRTLDRTDLLAGGLESGHYHWRVGAMRDDLEGSPTHWSGLRTTRFGEPPKLAVEDVPKVVESSRCVLKGRTRPGSKVIVAGEDVPVDAQGSFETTVTLEPGANVLTVEAIDAEGNATYWTKVVHGKF